MFQIKKTTSIEDIEGLIKGHVKGKVLKHEVRPLTEFGENYGSEILSVEITIEEEDGGESVLCAVAKLVPPTDFQKEIFNTPVTFKNEIAFYAEVVPTIQNFQRERGVMEVIDNFPKLYGARISLDPKASVVDKDAIILMENLKLSGYENLERQRGFDLQASKKVLSILAKFQATTTGLKIKRPDLFDSKIKPYLYEWKGHPPPTTLEIPLSENPDVIHLVPRLNKLLKKTTFRIKKIREPWSTIIHNDAWVNNIMVKLHDHEVEHVKFVDFQIFDQASFACDLVFLLLSSVQTSVLKYHLDKLFRFYYDEFIDSLARLKVDVKPFTYSSFLEEINIEAPFQIFHTMFMLPAIFASKGMPKIPGRTPEWNPNGTSNGDSSNPPASPPHKPRGPPIMKMSIECKEKMWFIVEEAAKRNWL